MGEEADLGAGAAPASVSTATTASAAGTGGTARAADVATTPTTASTAAQQVPVCATCGRSAPDLAVAQVTWARGSENGRDVWTCEVCSRDHLRSIEGKLDSSWW